MSYDFFLATGADDAPAEGLRAGTIALWRGTTNTDFEAAIDPLNNLASVRFHTDFDYMRLASYVTSRDAGMSPVTLPFTGEDGNIDQETLLFAHGMTPVPLVMGLIEISGYKQPLAGCMQPLPGGSAAQPNWRICSLVWDDTNVYLRTRGGRGAAATVHWEVLVFEEPFQARAEADVMIRLDPEAVVGASVDKVAENYRYLKTADASGVTRLLGGSETVIMALEAGNPVLRGSDGVTSYATHHSNSNTATASYSVTGQEVEF